MWIERSSIQARVNFLLAATPRPRQQSTAYLPQEFEHVQRQRGRPQIRRLEFSSRASPGKLPRYRRPSRSPITRSRARLFARRRLRLRGDRGRSARGGQPDDPAKISVAVLTNGTAVLEPRRHRPAREQAGHGGQGGPVQEIRRHRCLRYRGEMNAERRPARRYHRRAGADIRRRQSRGHQGGPKMFRRRGGRRKLA